jgi:hypothetical protein
MEVEEEQPPEKTCKTGLKPVAPVTCTLNADCVATKLYHTSSLAVPAHAGNDCVALAVVPVTGTQAEEAVNVIAPKQLSFEGCEKPKKGIKSNTKGKLNLTIFKRILIFIFLTTGYFSTLINPLNSYLPSFMASLARIIQV